MTAKVTTAEVVKSYGMRPVGGFGVRGFRAFCPACGFLSAVCLHIRSAQHRANKHRCGAPK